MKKSLKRLMAGMLAVMLLAMPTVAMALETTADPGEAVSLDKGDFYSKSNGGGIDPGVKLSTSNFKIERKSITKGAELIDEIRINNRTEEVQIVLKSGMIKERPTKPNVIISNITLKSIRNLEVDGTYLLRRSDSFTYNDTVALRVGTDAEELDIYREDTSIDLISGDSRLVEWGNGEGVGRVTVNYGSIAVGEHRAVDGDRVKYSYSDSVPSWLLTDNPSAYIQGLDIGTQSFEYPMTLQILANKDDYIYEYADGRLKTPTGLKWDELAYAWVTKLSAGKRYIISDTKLYGTSAASGSSGGTSYENDNPPTGGGSNVAVTLSAIVAILAISALSIIMSTILSIKKK